MLVHPRQGSCTAARAGVGLLGATSGSAAKGDVAGCSCCVSVKVRLAVHLAERMLQHCVGDNHSQGIPASFSQEFSAHNWRENAKRLISH